LYGYIDIHSHCMFGFDDGAAEREETLAMLSLARENGFSIVAATPHVMTGVYEHDREVLQESIDELADDLAKQATGLELVAGAEYYLDDGFDRLMENGALYGLNGSDHMLVELPLLKIPPMARDWSFRMRIKGLVPILAHPERYADVMKKPGRIEQLREAGYLVQINLGSLIGMYGRRARKAAEFMLKNDLVDFAASDAHTPKYAAEIYGEGVQQLNRLVGEQQVRRLLHDNPRIALGLDEQAGEN